MTTNSEQSGAIIIMDGPDGVGKTTQIALAAEAFALEGHDIHTTRAHGGTPFGELLRGVSLSETPRSPITDLHLSRTIHAELAVDLAERKRRGQICFVDRGPAAMWAYQVWGSGLSAEYARPVVEEDMKMMDSDLMLVYIASLDVLKRQRNSRGGKGDYFENKGDDYHQRVIEGYGEAARLFQGTLVDAAHEVDEVHDVTMAIIRSFIKKHK